MDETPVQSVDENSRELTDKLVAARRTLAGREVTADELFYDLRGEEMQIAALDVRLAALREDLQRNKDNLKLKSFGSVQSWRISDETCPTCRQKVADSLLPQTENENPMSLEDNITFIQSQIGTFERLRNSSLRALEKRESALLAVRDEITGLRVQIRALRQTLTSAGNAPSLASVRERVELEDRVRLATKAQEEFSENFERFGELAAEWKAVQERRAALPKQGISQKDRAKLGQLQAVVRAQLKEFGFQSVKPESIEISEETYRPTREGFNLGFDLSASDNIRLIWAYLQGLLELAREFQNNHVGILIFDEPRQQETAELSFANLLKRASSAQAAGQQVIFATSENLPSLQAMISSVPHQLIAFDGRIVKRLDS